MTNLTTKQTDKTSSRENKIKGWEYLGGFSPNQVGLLKEYKELERKNEVRLVEEQESYLIKVYIPTKKENL